MHQAPLKEQATTEKAVARGAGLLYTSDSQPGIQRRKRGKNFTYYTARGDNVADEVTLSRIRSLAIPPAWKDVWICPSPQGHLQATGRDARSRKQYRYHAQWRAYREQTKFQHILGFARKLPKIRRKVRRDLAKPGMSRDKVLAAIIRLLEATLIRIGNQEYARTNGSYGLTTMLNRQARVKGENICFRFRGKSGVGHDITLSDRQVARVVRKCQEMPGQELFAYQDEAGAIHDIGSHDVNKYLRTIAGEEYTAKDFRTWAGTVLAALALREFEAFSSATQARKNFMTAIEAVATSLGNTPAVCRKCYVHPGILESYLSGATIDTVAQRMDAEMDSYLKQMRPEEAAVVVLLRRRLELAPGDS